MLKVLRELFVQGINDIDAGNSRISEEQQCVLIDIMSRMMNPQEKLSKEQALAYLRKHGIKISRATFDNYVADGKIPEGRHELGFNPKF